MALSKEQENWLDQNDSDGENFANVPEELSTEEFWKVAVAKNVWALKYVPEKWKTHALYQVMRYVAYSSHSLNSYEYDLNRVPEELRTEAVCLAAVQQDGWALEFVPEAARTEAVCFAAVQQDGWALEHVPEALKTEALYLTAVQQDGGALKFVPDAQKSETLCIEAVKQNMNAMMYVPEDKKDTVKAAKKE